jgi:hypothetical protein
MSTPLVPPSPDRSPIASGLPERAASLVAIGLLVLGLLASRPAAGQPLADTLVTWRGYARTSTAQVQVYPSPPEDERRDRTIVVRELAASRGPSTLDDVRYLADRIGRAYGLDPARVYWVLHWGAFSFRDATGQKELFLRVTFRRSDSGRLSSPFWRALTKTDVRELTDRRYRNPSRTAGDMGDLDADTQASDQPDTEPTRPEEP